MGDVMKASGAQLSIERIAPLDETSTLPDTVDDSSPPQQRRRMSSSAQTSATLTGDGGDPPEQQQSPTISSSHEHNSHPIAQKSSTPSSSRPFSAFSGRAKWGIVIISSIAGLYSPVSSSIFVPAIPVLTREFEKTTEQINLALTLYLIFQGITPSFWGSLADSIGRRPVYLSTLTIYVGACIGLALTPTNAYWLLLVLRCLQAAGGSAVIAIGAGCVADIATPEERGTFLGLFGGLSLLGPALGPLLGGILVYALSWRWIFWILAIASGVTTVALFFFLPETLRSVVGDGSLPPRTLNARPHDLILRKRNPGSDGDLPWDTRAAKKKFDPFGSFRMLLYPDIACMLLFTSMIYSLFYMVLTTYSTYLTDYYGYNDLQVGLLYLPSGIGAMAAALVNGRFLDWDFKRQKAALGYHPDAKASEMEDFPFERVRLRILPWVSVLVWVAAIGYGWGFRSRTSVAVPAIMSFFVAIGMQAGMSITSVMCVDLFPGAGGSITASFNLTRCLMGAAFTAAIEPIINRMGIGWAFVLVVGINVVLIPLPLLLLKKGPQWRKNRARSIKKREEAREERRRKKASHISDKA